MIEVQCRPFRSLGMFCSWIRNGAYGCVGLKIVSFSKTFGRLV